MSLKLKTLGLAFATVLAMSAVAASAASAHVFHSEVEKTTITGTQVEKNKFTIAGQAVECATATFAASASEKTVSEIENVVPTYGTCTYGAELMTVTMEGCTYTLSSTTDANGDALTKINCPAGKHVTIDLSKGCKITLKEAAAANGTQTATGGVHYTNEGAGTARTVLIDLTATFKVSHDWTGEGAEPLSCKNIVGTGKLTGTVTVKGTSGGVQVGLWVE